jgi:tetratricopeptide (TPR) repeat protein
LIPHVMAVGDELVIRYEISKSDIALIIRALNFAVTIKSYVFHRPQMIDGPSGRERLGLHWLELGLTISLQTKALDHQRLFYNQLALLYDDIGENQKALKYFEEALSLDRLLGDKVGIATRLNNIGSVWGGLGEDVKALDYLEQALLLLHDLGDESREATMMTNIGLTWRKLGNTLKARAYYEQSLSLMHSLGDKRGEARTLNNIGALLLELKDQQASIYFEQALILLRKVGDQNGEVQTLNNMGVLWSDQGDIEKALESYEQALHLIFTIGDPAMEAGTLQNIAKLMSDSGDKRKALEYFEQAIKIIRTMGHSRMEAKILNDIGTIWVDLGEKNKGIIYYEHALSIARSNLDRQIELEIINNIAFVYFSENDLLRASESLRQIILIAQDVDRAKELLFRYNLAQTLFSMNQIHEAIGELEIAITIFKRYQIPCDQNGANVEEYEALFIEWQNVLGQNVLDQFQTIELLKQVFNEQGANGIRETLKGHLDVAEIEELIMFLAENNKMTGNL